MKLTIKCKKFQIFCYQCLLFSSCTLLIFIVILWCTFPRSMVLDHKMCNSCRLSHVTINNIRRPPIVQCKICQQISMCERRFNQEKGYLSDALKESF